MPRRASSKIQPIWIVAVVAAAILVVGLGFVLESQGGDPFRTVAELNLQDYLSDARSLRGNSYKVKGMIYQSLGYSRNKGRLVSVEVGSGADSNMIPILIPPDLSYLNLQKGQRYVFRLEVGDSGILLAKDMKKS